ncbi:DUF3493 domain-containing protein [Romeria aff. gracilis LEGE 07310]|uniref:DUF3493 domain-containing protein n=1 Tax=Vasconcelosia minhoensis LEGE 07310 TaxID=915328 RepID=A0A8J7DMU2_9CYAN|nr:DUF3493 domain-containing protein [Romeria gracilis]MBE9077300.1 DUF3493 domain-containing protein [Romeria aff. gracilis LEGE 07310]
MAEPNLKRSKSAKGTAQESSKGPPEGMSQEKYARLLAEAKAPYKGLRKFIYGAVGASGLIGAFVFFGKLLSGRDLGNTFANFAFQAGLVALMVFLFRLEDRDDRAD